MKRRKRAAKRAPVSKGEWRPSDRFPEHVEVRWWWDDGSYWEYRPRKREADTEARYGSIDTPPGRDT